MSGLTSIPTKIQVHPMRSPERVAALIKALAEEVGLHDGSTVGSLVARVGLAETSVTAHAAAIGGTGAALLYAPTTAGDWASTAPTTVRGALDRLATLIKTLNTGTGA